MSVEVPSSFTVRIAGRPSSVKVIPMDAPPWCIGGWSDFRSRHAWLLWPPSRPRNRWALLKGIPMHIDRGNRNEGRANEQARKVSSEAVPEWAQGLYYNKGLFDKALVKCDKAVYFGRRQGGPSKASSRSGRKGGPGPHTATDVAFSRP
jgi:hypothetical protein